jgi:hypothetical protein
LPFSAKIKLSMKITSLLVFFVSATLLRAQDFKEWSVTPEELDMKSYSKDTSAQALVLNEFGDARITDDDHSHHNSCSNG